MFRIFENIIKCEFFYFFFNLNDKFKMSFFETIKTIFFKMIFLFLSKILKSKHAFK